MAFQPQKTIQFKTALKTALVDALQSTFQRHPDPLLQDLKVDLEYSFSEVDYPSIVVRYRGMDVQNAGVGHIEKMWDPTHTTITKHKRRLYHGDLEFTIYALSSQDRDIISDALVEIVGLSDLTTYTNYFMARLYAPKEWQADTAMSDDEFGDSYLYTLTNLNSDLMSDLGDSTTPAPWEPEDVYLYQGGYRVPVMGEVLSLPPDVFYTTIKSILQYPYIAGIDPIPTGSDDPAPWIGS